MRVIVSKSIGRSPPIRRPRAALGSNRRAGGFRTRSNRRRSDERSGPSQGPSIDPAVLDFGGRCVLRRGLGRRRLVEPGHLVAVEIYRDAARVDMAGAPVLQIVDIIPAFLIE